MSTKEFDFGYAVYGLTHSQYQAGNISKRRARVVIENALHITWDVIGITPAALIAIAQSGKVGHVKGVTERGHLIDRVHTMHSLLDNERMTDRELRAFLLSANKVVIMTSEENKRHGVKPSFIEYPRAFPSPGMSWTPREEERRIIASMMK